MPDSSPEYQEPPNSFCGRDNPISGNQHNKGGTSTSIFTNRSLVLLPRPPVLDPCTHQALPTPIQSNTAPQRPVPPRVPIRRSPPKQWEVMQAILNPEFENSPKLLQHCYTTYNWTEKDAISFAISGVPEPRIYLRMPIRSREYQTNHKPSMARVADLPLPHPNCHRVPILNKHSIELHEHRKGSKRTCTEYHGAVHGKLGVKQRSSKLTKN